MKKNSLTLFLIFSLSLIYAQDPKKFNDKALLSSSYTLNGEKILFKDILKEHKGKKIFIDIWASWCHDCIKSLPKVKELQQKVNPSKVDFVYLSVDKEEVKWKNAIKKFDLKGAHYYQTKGWKSELNEFLGLDWIPRYLIVDENGGILLFKSIKIEDENLFNLLNK